MAVGMIIIAFCGACEPRRCKDSHSYGADRKQDMKAS